MPGENGVVSHDVFHAFLNNIVSDLPASHKLNGLRGHTSEHFMCDTCEVPFSSLVNPECFDTACEPLEYFKLIFDTRCIVSHRIQIPEQLAVSEVRVCLARRRH